MLLLQWILPVPTVRYIDNFPTRGLVCAERRDDVGSWKRIESAVRVGKWVRDGGGAREGEESEENGCRGKVAVVVCVPCRSIWESS